MSLFFPFSSDREAPGSFQIPVPPPKTPPGGGTQIKVCFSEDWLPYILGSLFQLTMNTTWAVSTQEELGAVLSDANQLIYLFQSFKPCDEVVSALPECGDCEMGCCLRFNNGVLQMLSCGEWVDVPGQTPQGQNAPGQPAQGSPQPTPGNCAQYSAKLNSNDVWLLPALVSTGDTVQISNAFGATSDTEIVWRCPDGFIYAAGACGEVPFMSPDAPMPGVQYGKLIGKIGTTYYDIYSGSPWTVPSGVELEQLIIQFNYQDISTTSGQVTFNATLCNTQTPVWREQLDFAYNPFGWLANQEGSCSAANWEIGCCWSSEDCSGPSNHYRTCDITLSKSFHMTRFSAIVNWTPGVDFPSGDGAAELVVNGSVVGVIPRSAMPGTGNGVIVDFLGLNLDVTNIIFELTADYEPNATPLDGIAQIVSIVIYGSGSNPFA